MGRSPCCDKNGLKKGPWTPEEDMKLIQYIQMHGPGNWRSLPKNAGLERCGKSCRLRWTNYLRPDIKRGRFSFEEEETIIHLHSVLGNKWSAIAAKLPGRTDNEIKNYWNTHIRKRLLRMGIDPVTHAPRLDLVGLSSLLNSPDQFNLSNLLRLQTLVNPDALRLAATLLASNETPLLLLQKFQEDQLLNSQLQNQSSKFHSNKCESGFDQQIPVCSQLNVPSYSFPQTDLVQSMQGNGQMYQDTSPNFGHAASEYPRTDLLENSSFQSLNSNGSTNNSQNISLSSLLSTPLSSPKALNSASSSLVHSRIEDERESYFSELLKFEIPESLDFEDFM